MFTPPLPPQVQFYCNMDYVKEMREKLNRTVIIDGDKMVADVYDGETFLYKIGLQ